MKNEGYITLIVGFDEMAFCIVGLFCKFLLIISL